MHPILLTIGPITLHTYGLMVALGFLAGFYLARKEFDRRGIDPTNVDNLLFFVVLSGLFGSRLFYFLFVVQDDFFKDPLSLFRIWEGGLVFYGGFLVALFVVMMYARYKELSPIILFDALVPSLFIAHALGRVGCFAAGCCYGTISNSPLSVVFSHPQTLAPMNIPLHPTQLYSALGNIVLFVGALALTKRNLKVGYLSSYYLVGYGIFRFIVEYWRDDYRGHILAGLYPSQLISIALIVTGLLFFVYGKKSKEL